MKHIQRQNLVPASGSKARRKGAAVAAAALLLLACRAGDSFAITKGGIRSFGFGNDYAGASGVFSTITETRSDYSRIDVNANGSLKLLKRSVRGIEFKATAESMRGAARATYKLSLAGYTVDSGTRSHTHQWNLGPVTRTLVQASNTVFVGPIPVTLTGSLGGSARISYGLYLNPMQVSMYGSGSSWAVGSAKAGVGVPGAQVGARADLRLLQTSLVPSVTVSPTSWVGRADVIFQPVGIYLLAFAEACIPVPFFKDICKKIEKQLVGYSLPGKTETLVRF